MKTLYFFLLFACTLASCKKAKVESVNTNNSRDSLTYQPKVPGSTWTYRRTVGDIDNTTYTYTRLSADTTAYGFVFNIFSSTDNTNGGNQYIRQEGGKYYSILTASTNKPALLILDTAKNINESWLGGVNGSDTYTFTMKQKINTYILDNFAFKNVLVVHLNRTGPNPLSADTYYAQGVGQVKSDGTANVSGFNVSVNVKLISIDLK
jgi:hypothetical protein